MYSWTHNHTHTHVSGDNITAGAVTCGAEKAKAAERWKEQVMIHRPAAWVILSCCLCAVCNNNNKMPAKLYYYEYEDQNINSTISGELNVKIRSYTCLCWELRTDCLCSHDVWLAALTSLFTYRGGTIHTLLYGAMLDLKWNEPKLVNFERIYVQIKWMKKWGGVQVYSETSPLSIRAIFVNVECQIFWSADLACTHQKFTRTITVSVPSL